MGLFPLHVAILRNNPVSRNDMVQQLLNKGADINVKAIPVCSMLIFFLFGGGGGHVSFIFNLIQCMMKKGLHGLRYQNTIFR